MTSSTALVVILCSVPQLQELDTPREDLAWSYLRKLTILYAVQDVFAYQCKTINLPAETAGILLLQAIRIP